MLYIQSDCSQVLCKNFDFFFLRLSYRPLQNHPEKIFCFIELSYSQKQVTQLEDARSIITEIIDTSV